MSGLASFAAGGLAAILAMEVLAPSASARFTRTYLLSSPASFNTRFEAVTSPSAAPASLYDVNRAAKASRLVPARTATDAISVVPKQGSTPGAQRPTHDVVRDVDPSREVEPLPATPPIGCDPAYSILVRVAPARFTGRCTV